MEIGSKIPKFELNDLHDNSYSPADFEEDYLVLFFYPKDSTPGCTLETQQFDAKLAKFKKLRTKVIGVSGGTAASKQKFCEKFGFKVILLSDTDFSLAKSLGAYGEKSFMGKSFLGILRQTFVFDKQRNLIKVFDKVKPDGHAEEVLNFIQTHAKE